MKVIVDLCVVPIGTNVSLSPYVAACERVFAEKGLSYTLHANGTNIEGDWDDVFTAVRQCHEVLHAMGVVRIFSTLKVGTRSDRDQTMGEKIRSVEQRLSGLRA
jgi:uncharacterized protein (TIGR00106 family)